MVLLITNHYKKTYGDFKLPTNLNDRSLELKDFENKDNDEEPIDLPENLQGIIKEAISILGGNVFPKINNKAPTDAKWINLNHSLMCSCLDDILLILKASSIIQDTLDPSYKWIDINPGYEFRSFVRDNKLVGISQKDTSHLYEYIKNDFKTICTEIIDFYERHVATKFPSSFFSFDVYREKENNILIIDFNKIIDNSVSTSLFDYEELRNCDLKEIFGSYNHSYKQINLPFRFIQESSGIQPFKSHNIAYPHEICHLNQYMQL